MRRRHVIGPLFVLAALAFAGLVGCGSEEEEHEVVEGQPLELGEVTYNVQITRFLNPNDVEDRAYLAGVPPAGEGKEYLASFLRIDNHSDETQQLPEGFQVIDTRGDTYDALEVQNPWALPLGAPIPAEGTVPAPDTPAASGPIKGAMVLFEVDQGVTENRPLELEIADPGGESGTVELDI